MIDYEQARYVKQTPMHPERYVEFAMMPSIYRLQLSREEIVRFLSNEDPAPAPVLQWKQAIESGEAEKPVPPPWLLQLAQQSQAAGKRYERERASRYPTLPEESLEPQFPAKSEQTHPDRPA